mmetsp:Transcript_1257/g.3630  ORF Transcript_1257/g.3630 Transcript_1257/m.3630 type:complete len:166 (-) Transcript_1257:987-1484(-)|eukprot:CAMPEP_0198109450 /NCGR_PEP_ID=MMETSP1442-20131203/1479_1 /TAXON_ID= /ORGANISM="Craspedostauros australis, Strain CCMP3328" /LENGTH=165 /DNA_ID=CAMNT_0043765117 /DNA_START=214 /DNA_END=711 /DNA_ORIENTATION=+
MGNKTFPPPCVMGEESIMSPKAYGTSAVPIQQNLRWECDVKKADQICNHNRHYAEHSGYFQTKTKFLEECKNATAPIEFFDSNTGKLLFTAPVGRTMDQFLIESRAHGWPSFRDEEVNWEYVRCLKDGETVSVDGTHLGHNLPDSKGSRYCINLVCVAGVMTESS